MAYGINLKGSDGSHIISSEWHMLKFVGKGSNISKICSVNRLGKLCYYGVISSPALSLTSAPTLFYNIASGKNLSLSRLYSYDATHWRIDFNSYYDVYPDTYWFEEIDKDASDDTHGMRLYDADSNLIFDSGWLTNDILRIKAIYNLTATNGQSITVASAITKPALIFYSKYCRLEEYEGGYDNNVYDHALKNVSNVFTVEEQCVQSTRYPYGAYDPQTIYDGSTYIVPVINGADYD